MLENNILDGEALCALTEKQREVLDLLLEHKTSKEIARCLAISPHTVDQRIQFAKQKLGAGSRSELALAYRDLCAAYEPMTHEDSHIASPAFTLDHARTNEAEGHFSLTHPDRFDRDKVESAEADYRVVPEMFEGRHATLVRLGTIAVLALVLIFVALGGLAMFDQLSQMFAS